MKIFNYLLIALSLITTLSCTKSNSRGVSFYHWKSKAEQSSLSSDVISKSGIKTIYMHYFDVDIVEDETYYRRDKVFPVYPLTKVDEGYKVFEIVPVVFIVNNALKEIEPDDLSSKISSLVNEISSHHFNKKFSRIQIDCDWNQSTRENYFKVLSYLKNEFEVEVTIRLHQIKYPQKTGVPPVKHGVLMLYNVGDLANFEQNSILDSKIVADYLNLETEYPLTLDVALPIFSQTVIKNNKGKIKIINGVDSLALSKKNFFKSITQSNYEVLTDTLFHGFYLSPGNMIKTEKLTEEDIINSYQIVKNTKLHLGDVIFYHLDEEVLKAVDLNKMLSEL